MIALIGVAAFVSVILALFLIRGARSHSRRYAEDMPQRFHAGHVPRIGGVAVLGGLAAGLLVAGAGYYAGDPFNVRISISEALLVLAVLLPAVLGGAYEDVTQSLPVRWRLALTALSGLLALWLLDLRLVRVDVQAIDSWLRAWSVLGMAFVVFAICGLPHAFNLIDGYNGLAGTVALLVCLAIAHVALQVGDRQLAALVLCLAGATTGFLLWNYPRGLIFAGDGGAYLWGVVIAIASVMLVQRHGEVSPWFPMLLLIYPVWEVIFSIYRKAARGQSPSMADALHFHQLIYRRIVREVFHDDDTRRMLMRNNRTSPYLWGFTLLTVVPAVLFWQNSFVLKCFCLLFAVSYIYMYVSIVRFRVPRWLRR
ncbi:glycosyltransferase family 4 protein [Ramlibacter algicola]|uniref:Glycosyl transferase n=1 Tax=Ramlibacter algicola TaxID=2795217 RepID=A0A934PWT9_9BURK|nr:glycosyltransferase [Ramlibacter algicola]MBK0391955.1 glycosyl transferase [Ramlibacter algicola]